MNANGRVDILGHNAYNRFGLHDRIPVQQPDTYYKEALTGNWNCTTLSSSFLARRTFGFFKTVSKQASTINPTEDF